MKPLLRPFVCAAALILGSTASGQAPSADPAEAPLPKWFLGSWDVVYQDSLLHRVRAQVTVTQPAGHPSVRYVAVDPRNGTKLELWAFSIHANDDEVIMDLPPGGPSAILGVNAEPTPDPPGLVVIHAPAGSRLSATLDAAHVEAPVNPVYSRSGTHLRLARRGAELSGEWITTRDEATGFQGARSGIPGNVTRSAPPPLDHVTIPAMHGWEIWTPTHMVVEKTERITWTPPRGADVGRIAGTATVLIQGRNLPIGLNKKAGIHFDDPKLTAVNVEIHRGPGENTLVVPVQLDRGAIPGSKTFTLTEVGTENSAPGTWVFDWPGLPLDAVYHARQVRDATYEPTGVLLHQEYFYVEALLADTIAGRSAVGDNRFYFMRTEGGDSLSFHLVRDPANPLIYRAGPFVLLEPNAELPAFMNATHPEFTSNQTTLVTPSPDRPFFLRAKVGDLVLSSPASKSTGDTLGLALAEVEAVPPDGDEPFQRALRQAEAFRRQHPEPERYDITSYEPFKVIKETVKVGLNPLNVLHNPVKAAGNRTHVTVADHAALILLQEALAKKMGAAMRQAMKVPSKSELQAQQDQVLAQLKNGEDAPILEQMVPAPRGYDKPMAGDVIRSANRQLVITLREALTEARRRQKAGDPMAAAYISASITQAQTGLTGQLGSAIIHVDGIDLSKPSELLPVVKVAYNAVVAGVLQRMVKHARLPGATHGLLWESDEVGRSAVRGVADLLETINADEALAGAQMQFMTLVSLPVGMLVVPGLAEQGLVLAPNLIHIGIEALTFTNSVNNVLAWDENSRAARFAQGAAPVTGMGAYRGAQSAANIAGVGMVMDVVMPITLGTARRVFRASPAAVESELAYAVGRATRQGAENLPPDLAKNLLYAAGRAEQRAALNGLNSLGEIDREALRALYPQGFPPDVAAQLRVPAGDPTFTIRTDIRAEPPATVHVALPDRAGAATDAASPVTTIYPKPDLPPEGTTILPRAEMPGEIVEPDRSTGANRITPAALPPQMNAAELAQQNQLRTAMEQAQVDVDFAYEFATQPHTGNARINRLVNTDVALNQRIMEFNHASPQEIAAAEPRVRAQFTASEPVVQRIEGVVGTRRVNDYLLADISRAQGCTTNESVVGYFYSRARPVDTKRLMTVLNLDRAGLEQALDEYLIKAQRVGDAATRAHEIQNFLGPR